MAGEDSMAAESLVTRWRNGTLLDSESKTGSSRAEVKRSGLIDVGSAFGSSSSSLMARQASSRVAAGLNCDCSTSPVFCSTDEEAACLLGCLVLAGRLLACLLRKLALGCESDGEAGLGKLRDLTWPGIMMVMIAMAMVMTSHQMLLDRVEFGA